MSDLSVEDYVNQVKSLVRTQVRQEGVTDPHEVAGLANEYLATYGAAMSMAVIAVAYVEDGVVMVDILGRQSVVRSRLAKSTVEDAA